MPPFFLRARAFLSLFLKGGYARHESCLEEQSVWFLPQVTAAGGDEQERGRPVESEVNTASGWKLLGNEGNENRKQEPRPACGGNPIRLRA